MIYPRILPSQKVSRTLLGGILHFPNVLYVFFVRAFDRGVV